jgi:hypothetical protein
MRCDGRPTLRPLDRRLFSDQALADYYTRTNHSFYPLSPLHIVPHSRTTRAANQPIIVLEPITHSSSNSTRWLSPLHIAGQYGRQSTSLKAICTKRPAVFNPDAPLLSVFFFGGVLGAASTGPENFAYMAETPLNHINTKQMGKTNKPGLLN